MSDKSNGVVLLFVFIGIWFLAVSVGVFVGKDSVANDCVDFGKTKIHGKWYECKPK